MYPPSSPQLLVVAAPGEARGSDLAEALRRMGWVVTLATTPEQAMSAAQYTGCVVVLTPATKDDPAIHAALAARPARLVPFFAEPMVLPYGSWTSGPVRLGEDMTTSARGAIEALFPVVAPAAPPALAPASPFAAPLSSAHPFTPPSPAPHRSGRVLALALSGATLALLLVVTTVLIMHGIGKAGTTGSLTPPTATPNPTLTIANPGVGCDMQERALWRATDAVAQECTAQGTVLSMPGDDGYLQGLFFSLPDNTSIPISYRVAVTGTLLHGDANEELFLSVHEQMPGGQLFEAFANSEWQVYHISDTDQDDTLLSRGFSPKPLTTMTLSAEVDGAVMHFAINGKTVTTVTDATYQTTPYIFFGMGDYSSAKKAFSARFSDFTYTPLPDPTLTTGAAVATATAQAVQQDRTPYRAAVPGFGCDHGGGVWSPISFSGDGATKLTCTASGMLLEHTRNTGYIGEENFYWRSGIFPGNYSVTATVTLLTQQECGDILTRNDSSAGYSFRVCDTGYWAITKYDSKGNPTDLVTGYVAAQAQHTLRATDNGSQQSLMIDGALVGSITDSAYHTTAHIGLAIDTDSFGALVFSDFVFTPLP
jgi:hypothetical protein